MHSEPVALSGLHVRQVTVPAQRRALGQVEPCLGALLVSDGVLTPDQLRLGFEEQGRTGEKFGSIVVERGWATAASL